MPAAATTTTTTIFGPPLTTNSVLNMILFNKARGFHVQPDRQRILQCIGQADFDTCVTAYTANFAALRDVANRNPLGATTCPSLPTRRNNASSTLGTLPDGADKRRGESGISCTHR